MTKKAAESTVPYSLSRDTFETLSEIADTKEASVREIIDELVQRYLDYGRDNQRVLKSGPVFEKRSFCRKSGDIPAILQTSDSKRNFNARSATIRNLSMGGALFTIPKSSEVVVLDNETPVEIIFYLNKQEEPLILQGRARRLEQEQESVFIGMEFVDCDFTDYQELARYVLQ
ncbi:PilZ domain-containing protein [Oceanidesulfovibrio marinus]|nr:PilZ domain-containing protein [Oceanidesulfovibrio marinus]